jgi:DNA-binding transcriptional MerR regulator/effector-binding domain-containing protein
MERRHDLDRLSIGKMAEINGVSVQALRLYDKMDLLKPQFVDSNRYRYYSIKQSARLDMIQNLQILGMSLKQIKEQLDKQNVSVIQELLEIQRSRLDDQIRQLEATRKSVDRTLVNYRRYNEAPKDGTIFTEFMGKRKIYRYDIGINFYDFGIETYEYILRELKNHISLNALPMAYFCNVGTIIREDRLKRREFVSTEAFIFVDDDFASSPRVETLPSKTYLCISCDNFHKEREYAERLLAYADANGYTIGGDYVCEVITDLPVFVDNERGMFIKLQIPLEF